MLGFAGGLAIYLKEYATSPSPISGIELFVAATMGRIFEIPGVNLGTMD